LCFNWGSVDPAINGAANGRTAALLFALGPLGGAAGPFRSPSTTTTSGWNDDERTLTSATPFPSGSSLTFNIPLDEQVDVQPLVLGKVKVTAGPNPGDHRVGVATESNVIYMIDTVKWHASPVRA
jgi:hypothetical protein